MIFFESLEYLVLSNNDIAENVSELNEQYLPAYAWRRGTNAPEAARAAVTVLFTINWPIVRRLHADPFGDTESRRRRFVINHVSSPSQIATSRLHHATRDSLRTCDSASECVEIESREFLEEVSPATKSECTWRSNSRHREKKKRRRRRVRRRLDRPRSRGIRARFVVSEMQVVCCTVATTGDIGLILAD